MDPTPESDASTSTTNWWEESGKVRIGAEVKQDKQHLRSRGPLEWAVLGGEGRDEGCHRAVVPDKAALEIDKAQAASELLVGGGG